MKRTSELKVFFDEYPRYKTVEQVLDFYRRLGGSDTFCVLEIGSNEHKHLKLFLPHDDILFTDVVLTKKMQEDPEFQLADGTDLPFEDNSFDFVVATDVLEHIPREKRECLLAEACRVGRIAVILTFPYASEDIINAEMRVNQYYKTLNGEDYIWLKQHAENGLPELGEVNAALNHLGCKYLCHFRGNLQIWEQLYYSLFDAFLVPESYDYHRQIDFYYIKEVYAGDVLGTCYRAVYVISHAEVAPLEDYLRSLQKKIPQEKFNFLDTLFAAQRQIYSLREKLDLQKDLMSKQAHIKYLEAQNDAIETQWKKDVVQWERDSDLWKRDVKQWEKDFAQWKNDVEQWERDVEYLRREVEYWKKAAMQLGKDVELWKVAYDGISNAFFWKITRPLRVIFDTVKRLSHPNKN